MVMVMAQVTIRSDDTAKTRWIRTNIADHRSLMNIQIIQIIPSLPPVGSSCPASSPPLDMPHCTGCLDLDMPFLWMFILVGSRLSFTFTFTRACFCSFFAISLSSQDGKDKENWLKFYVNPYSGMAEADLTEPVALTQANLEVSQNTPLWPPQALLSSKTGPGSGIAYLE